MGPRSPCKVHGPPVVAPGTNRNLAVAGSSDLRGLAGLSKAQPIHRVRGDQIGIDQPVLVSGQYSVGEA
jgi:hypothetical protein